MSHDAGRQVEAVLDVLAPAIDLPELGIPPVRVPRIRFDYEGHMVMPSPGQLRALAEEIVTAVRTASGGEP